MENRVLKSALARILLEGKHYKLPKNQLVHVFDDRMMLSIIKTGYIKRYLITDDGNKSVQSIYGPGDIFPLTPVYKALFDYDIYKGDEVYYYETISESNVYSISQVSLKEAINENPSLYQDLLVVSGDRLGSNIQRLENMALGSAHNRVAHQLAYYADKFGKTSNRGVEILLPLTHQTLASILNLARETVTHSLVRLQEKGLIVSDKNIIVPNVDALKRDAH